MWVLISLSVCPLFWLLFFWCWIFSLPSIETGTGCDSCSNASNRSKGRIYFESMTQQMACFGTFLHWKVSEPPPAEPMVPWILVVVRWSNWFVQELGMVNWMGIHMKDHWDLACPTFNKLQQKSTLFLELLEKSACSTLASMYSHPLETSCGNSEASSRYSVLYSRCLTILQGAQKSLEW
jgi:hypothetical protein